ncbi:hypothetical protein Pmani_032238 [Petrolisthes manimaculis]|uniref:BRCT domain-containing protein n=1 Tax=Petrolisthes manimaculis TaxID=1843537 RepID=A0AAE1NTP7_9EUCA|nr:hypothetical protein Pmani_032238 [Petrolisthes manimaculis]
MMPIPNVSPRETLRKFIFSDVSVEQQRIYKRKIEELGGVIVSTAKIIFNPQCTHVIARNFMVSEKVMSALAGGKWVLQPEYITHSSQLGYWADEAEFEWKTTNNVPRSCRLRWNKIERGVFAGYSIYLQLISSSNTASFRRVLSCGGAEVVDTNMATKATIAISELECLEDVKKSVRSNCPIVTIAYIKDTVFLKSDPSHFRPYLLNSPGCVTMERKEGLSQVLEKVGKSHSQEKHPLSEANNNSIKKPCPSLESNGMTNKKVNPLRNFRKSPEANTSSIKQPCSSLESNGMTNKKVNPLRNFRKSPEANTSSIKQPCSSLEKNEMTINKSSPLQNVSSNQRCRQNSYVKNPSTTSPCVKFSSILELFPKEKRERFLQPKEPEDEGYQQRKMIKLSQGTEIATIRKQLDFTPKHMERMYIGKSDVKQTVREDVKDTIKPERRIVCTRSNNTFIIKWSTCDIVKSVKDETITWSICDSNKGNKVKGVNDKTLSICDSNKDKDRGVNDKTRSTYDSNKGNKDNKDRSVNDKTWSACDSNKDNKDRGVNDKTWSACDSNKDNKDRGVNDKTRSTYDSNKDNKDRSVNDKTWNACDSNKGNKDRGVNDKTYTQSKRYSGDNAQGDGERTKRRIIVKTEGENFDKCGGNYNKNTNSDCRAEKSLPKHEYRTNNKRHVSEQSLSSSNVQKCPKIDKPVILNKRLIVKVERLETWYPAIKKKSLSPPVNTLNLSESSDVSLKKQNLSPVNTLDFSESSDVSQKMRSVSPSLQIDRLDMKSGIRNFLRKSRIQDNTYCGFFSISKRDASDDNIVSSTNNNKKYPTVRELTLEETSYYESSLEHHIMLLSSANSEEDGIISQGIDTLRLNTTLSTYPPAHIMGNLLKTLIFETKFTLIHYQALGLANYMLMLHPPCTEHMKLYYLEVLKYAIQEEWQGNYRAWDSVHSVLKVLQQATDQESENESLDQPPIIYKEHALDVLQFLVSLFNEDMKRFTSGDEVRKLLMWQVFLGHTHHLANTTPPIKQLLNKWVQMLSAPAPVRQCLAQLVTLLVEMAWRFGRSSLLPISTLPQSLNAISNELLICLKDSGPTVTVQLIQELPSPWIKAVVSSIIFQDVTKGNNTQIFLRDIMDFFVALNTSQPQKNGKSPIMKVPGLPRVGSHNVNKRNPKGETILMRECIKNNVERVRLLLSVPGLDINLGDNNGWTALHEASLLGHDEVVKCLLNFNSYDNFTTTDVPCSLIKRDYYKNSINASVKGGEELRTPLQDSVINNHIATAKLLLDYGGKELLEDTDSSGRNALDMAKSAEMRILLNQYIDTVPKASLGKPLIFASALRSSFDVLPTRADCSNFAVSFTNSYLEACGYRSIMYYIRKTLKMRKKMNSTTRVGCDSPRRNSISSSISSSFLESYSSDQFSDSSLSQESKASSTKSVQPEERTRVFEEEALEKQVEEYMKLDMNTHRDIRDAKHALTHDMELADYLLNLSQ